MSLLGVSVDGRQQAQLGFKSYAPSQWPPSLSKGQKKFHEHTRCRGFTEEEVRFFKYLDRWKGGQYVEKAEKAA